MSICLRTILAFFVGICFPFYEAMEINEQEYYLDEEFGYRLLISRKADMTELSDNVRCAHTLLRSFPDMNIVIQKHNMEFQIKNPEYLIDGEVGDRKGIHSENGIFNAFKKAVKQGCRILVLDLDMHMSKQLLHTRQIAKHIAWRPDFSEEQIHLCYVVYRGRAVAVNSNLDGCDEIKDVIEKLKAE